MGRPFDEMITDKSEDGEKLRRQVSEALDQNERNSFEYLWDYTARRNQLPPEGDWRIWMIMAGRGFGKTRSGADWVRMIADANPHARIALASSSLAGQAQKEFFVNQALGLLDSLHARAIIASRPGPPAAAAEGEAFRVTATATGAWPGHVDSIAILIGGGWHFIAPAEGMLLFDRQAAQTIMFRSQWVSRQPLSCPSSGAVLNAEAHATLAGLIQALMAIGILGPAAP